MVWIGFPPRLANAYACSPGVVRFQTMLPVAARIPTILTDDVPTFCGLEVK